MYFADFIKFRELYVYNAIPITDIVGLNKADFAFQS